MPTQIDRQYHTSRSDNPKNKMKATMRSSLSPALILAAFAHHQATIDTTDALVLTPQYSRQHDALRFPSALHYANDEHHEHEGEPMFSSLPRPMRRRQRGVSDLHGSPTTADYLDGPAARRKPQRAIPHVDHASTTDAATRAGYIIRLREKYQVGSIQRDEKRLQTVRPLRRVVHRSSESESVGGKEEQQAGIAANKIAIHAPTSNNTVNVQVRNKRKNNRVSRLSLSKNPTLDEPTLDEFLDKPEQQLPGAHRVTFKATRTSSKSIVSQPLATLTAYVTQPVSQYSLLSFHDAEGGLSNKRSIGSSRGTTTDKPMSRRWLVRRLTSEESQRYILSSSIEDDEGMDESNLFRLAVPLLPLIGWDLTPVIDLEVIPPKICDTTMPDSDVSTFYSRAASVSGEDKGMSQAPSNIEQSKWEPLKGIRKRMQSQGADENRDGSKRSDNNMDGPPAVKIRSLRVSLLSTQEEVNEVMSKSNNNADGQSNNNPSNSDRTMQKEAIDMVSKVEEWLKPQITFAAELSWNDGVSINGEEDQEALSTVTVKSTAITSLTIPKIPSDIFRATVPSAFLVKRLGATLTSQALAICLPRFLRQLEKDYNRWSGLGVGTDSSEKKRN